ncbi:hypothetical protein quinque_002159 [Culex quinquefasciatus]
MRSDARNRHCHCHQEFKSPDQNHWCGVGKVSEFHKSTGKRSPNLHPEQGNAGRWVGGATCWVQCICHDRAPAGQDDSGQRGVIALAILRLVELEKCVVEGAGASGLAAILAGHMDEFKGKRVVLLVCGGNIDTTIFGRCLERGLAAEGRLQR